MLFRKKKKEEPHSGDIFLAKGIYLEKPELQNGNIVLNCFLRSLIVFLLVMGSIGGFLSAFGITYNIGLVITFYLLLSMYFSFLYASPKMLYRDMGYIVFFIIFIGAIYMLRLHANSGFYVIINRVLKRAQGFFNLSGVREYEVQIDNDYLTVAIVAIFIGMVMIIILNIWMYSTMSMAWTILFTFPILFVPLYMMLTPGILYLIVLCAGYMAVMAFKANGHFVVFAWDAPFRVKGLKKDRITYTQDAGIFRQVLVTFMLIFFSMVVLTEQFMPPARFTTLFKEDKLRERTQETIGNFILLGFEGMYNHYESTGGMSGGKLGGVSNVRPDYLPDLIIRYTPYSNEAVYLKGFTGGRYGDNQWESLYNIENENIGNASVKDDVAIFKDESLLREAEQLQKSAAEAEQYAANALMDVKNVGANVEYLYYPYYTLFEDYSIYENHSLMPTAQGLKMQEETTYSFYPKIVWEDALGEILPKNMDVSQVEDVFLEVPEKNRKVIVDECERMGLTDEMTENEIVEVVRDYFQDNIPYTLKPGATPKGKDFINYFLQKNRKGYCAHFASAATLIFREMGIPARYVEGYAFSLETALASDLNREKKYEDYYLGYSAIGESAVLDVEVTDAMAHAWVEIYVDGFGWKVVEVTPSSSETEEEDDFWSAFTDFLNNNSVDSSDNDMVGNAGLNIEEYRFIVYVVLGGFAAFFAFAVGRTAIRKWLRYRRCHQKNQAEALIADYADICDMIRLCDGRFSYCKSHLEQLTYMCEHYQIIFDCQRMCRQLEQISYSNGSLLVEEMNELTDILEMIRKAIWKKSLWKDKIALIRR